MTKLTSADIETIRFLRTRGQHAIDIARIFSISKMDALLDAVLEHVGPAATAPAAGQAPVIGFLALDVVGGELLQDRDIMQVDRIKAPAQGREHGALSALIRELLDAGRTPPVIADLLGCPAQTVRNTRALDEDRRARNKMAPSGAPAAVEDRPRNAGTAAATCEATEQPHQGSDEVPPLRKAEEVGLAPQPSANVIGQSDRSTYFPPSAQAGSARDLAEIAAAALRSGLVKKTICPTAVLEPTSTRHLRAEDGDAHRRRFERLNAAAFAQQSERSKAAHARRRA